MNLKHLLIGTATVALLAACSSTKPLETAAPTENGSAGAGQSATLPADTGAAGQGTVAVDPLKDPNSPLSKRSVYFDFDSSAVKQSEQQTVANHAEYLKGHPNRKVVIQGNTDARGSREYNLGLGQRRAESVKNAMQVIGVKENQLEAVSFGKEKPKATGNTEADYAQNRRADIAYDGE
ncbi:peptidoglycan-associated lipoprotein Pal [Pseudogulbenkiania subflava]|uniref:Peptidoglycan-associated lipoprotein n=1 Tax=Pseudogulbenkiania subflava DSM 22618 TaxID=1123014 RepID=A0A1Y6B501_9NEIS|nr:peptidoglycan-associated lipoprotein Pal [Pseudogulbenkiania subflava]SME92502.1 peptidoglycan-associated lipoprotein [Pseudogulbenkiania subflava DSM 22618]